MDPQNQQSINPIQPIIQNSATPTRNLYKTILFILLGLIIIAGSIFLGMQISKNENLNQQRRSDQQILPTTKIEVTPTVLPTSNLSANFIIYNNSTYQFEFTYPKNYQIKENKGQYDNTLSIAIYNNNEQISIEIGADDLITRKDYYWGGYKWTKDLFDKLNRIEINSTDNNSKFTTTKLANISTEWLTGAKCRISSVQGSNTESFPATDTFILINEKGNRTFFILIKEGTSQETIDQIVNSLKVIE